MSVFKDNGYENVSFIYGIKERVRVEMCCFLNKIATILSFLLSHPLCCSFCMTLFLDFSLQQVYA